ncbi:hypothetical protein BJ508DRAFT_322210 [Ascobolus immersus RN42]|uniref:Cyanovirin-N domain-containing protein n=1 Tax=Ascobolus immersus RN42 TaxID=1160509 RepID=A0A3N4IIV1_ASCIM|nr:hypothetical protein BJ508DRAFT_322210 [Ascobolus immersus RN42]
MKFTTTTVLLAGATLLQTVSANFFLTCSNPRTDRVSDQFFLFADCADSAGLHHGTSSLDLSNCIVNDGGQLRAADNGGFSSSCTELSLDEGTRGLQALCENGHGGQDVSVVSLEFIENDEGVLSCFGHRGVYLGDLPPAAK